LLAVAVGAERQSGREEATPWPEIMAFGLGVLRLSPDSLWAISPPELRAAIDGYRGEAGRPAAPTRRQMAALMACFPDHSNPDGAD